MITATELCRKNLYKRMGVDTTVKRDPVKMEAEITRMTRKLDEVCQTARPRLIMGGIRYGSDWKHEPLMDYMQKKFDTFRDTGNYEMLIDLVNFVAIEGVLKTHPKSHFNAIDRKE